MMVGACPHVVSPSSREALSLGVGDVVDEDAQRAEDEDAIAMASP